MNKLPCCVYLLAHDWQGFSISKDTEIQSAHTPSIWIKFNHTSTHQFYMAAAMQFNCCSTLSFPHFGKQRIDLICVNNNGDCGSPRFHTCIQIWVQTILKVRQTQRLLQFASSVKRCSYCTYMSIMKITSVLCNCWTDSQQQTHPALQLFLQFCKQFKVTDFLMLLSRVTFCTLSQQMAAGRGGK